MKTIRERIQASTFLTDGGLETDLIFIKNMELPHFAAFPLLDSPEQTAVLASYFKDYLEIAKQHNTSFILESPTWRANRDWGFKLGYNEEELFEVNQKAISLLMGLKSAYEGHIDDMIISGQLGPRGDGYDTTFRMTPKEAMHYHNLQIEAFGGAGVDMVSAITMTYPDEAMGIALAAQSSGLPVVISFTVETDGKLPSGDSLEEAIRIVDLATDNYPSYYMINCAHPSHFFDVLSEGKGWQSRIWAIRANASCMSHQELDESTQLDRGDVHMLGDWHRRLKVSLPHLTVYGGCCGTDPAHIKSICRHVA